mmetsp:Transcript_1639/g.3514  ORF Transcript_1639/g.3514 Transcript_1639/m.3514 type:complete len:234 (-) Transcript_1639:4-705(-)
MARSTEAIRKRALKRNRTVQDQRKADSTDIAAGEERERKKRSQNAQGEKKDKTTDDHVPVAKTGGGGDEDAATKKSKTTIKKTPEKENQTPVDDGKNDKEKERTNDPALKEPGSWICPGCKNHNFASRHACHSKTCDEKRPAGVHVPPRFQHPDTTAKSSRHDPATSKTMKWAEQASTDTVENNQALRKRYKETGGEGMEEGDVTRAKLLLERDERKKQKKELKKKNMKGKSK